MGRPKKRSFVSTPLNDRRFLGLRMSMPFRLFSGAGTWIAGNHDIPA